MRTAAMKYVIAGTAGHIDHGKTALVRALTGVDTDRLKEEKERGISIDLGFAHLDLPPDLRIGFVDVPGHERFIKNMLAGAGGIDLVLFVIAADESIKPQTREHFDICRLLHITQGIVVLTKADLVDSELLELAQLEVTEFVKGSFLEGAPVVAVSSITGAGIAELRDALAQCARSVRSRSTEGWFRLPIDRSFSMRGFGTVVTGTLHSGALAAEQEVSAYPEGRRVRVRGVQVHGGSVPRAFAGQRTAVNLADVEPGELPRGTVLAEAGRFAPTRQIDCAFTLLLGAKALKHRAPVHFHAGTAEVEAEARLFSTGRAPFGPGTDGYVRFLLREPVLLLPGDRFIVRMFSPVVTIGGGVVLDIAAPRKGGAGRLSILANGSDADRTALLVREAPHGLSLRDLVARTGLTESVLRRAAHGLVVLEEPQFWVLSPEWMQEVQERVSAVLKQYHRAHPLVSGMPKEELRSRELPGAPAFLLDAVLARTKTAAVEGELVRLTSHRVALQQDEEAASAKIEAAFASAGLAVPATSAVLAGSGVESVRARGLLQLLLKQRRLVRVGEELVFHTSAIETLKAAVVAKRGQRFGVAEFKEWTGISRKYAIPLLEFLDRERVTRRDGDSRVAL